MIRGMLSSVKESVGDVFVRACETELSSLNPAWDCCGIVEYPSTETALEESEDITPVDMGWGTEIYRTVRWL